MQTLILSCNTGAGHKSCAQAVQEAYQMCIRDRFSGITKFVNSFDLSRFGVRGWGWVTAFGLLMAAAGFLSFMDPLAAAVTLSVLAGLFLMIQGVVSIACGCLSGRFWM